MENLQKLIEKVKAAEENIVHLNSLMANNKSNRQGSREHHFGFRIWGLLTSNAMVDTDACMKVYFACLDQAK